MKLDRRILYVGITVHVIYFVISLLLFYFTAFSETSDFLTYHNAGRIILEDINDLYNQENYNFPYRYFPISAYFFSPFALLGLEIGYFVFQICSLVLNFISCYLIYHIADKIQSSNDLFKSKDLTSNKIKYVALYLMFFPHFMNYSLGQINNFITIFLLLALLFFLKGTMIFDVLGGILVGISISIKPLAIFIIPFILVIRYDTDDKKFSLDFKSILFRLGGVVVPMLISLLYFLLFPALLQGFIDINLSGEYTEEGINNSISITRAILNLFFINSISVSNILIFAILTAGVAVPGFLIYIIRKNSKVGINEGIILGMTIMLLVYFDSWDHHLVSLTPFISLFLILNDFDYSAYEQKWLKYFRVGYYLLASAVVLLSALFFMTWESFPFNFWGSIFLLFIYISVLKYSLFKERPKE